MEYIEKRLIALTLQLNLTPEQEKLAKETLAKNGQTPEEAFMSFIYLKNEDNKRIRYSRMMENPYIQRIHADVDENGFFVILKDTPEHVKDWVRYAWMNFRYTL